MLIAGIIGAVIIFLGFVAYFVVQARNRRVMEENYNFTFSKVNELYGEISSDSLTSIDKSNINGNIMQKSETAYFATESNISIYKTRQLKSGLRKEIDVTGKAIVTNKSLIIEDWSSSTGRKRFSYDKFVSDKFVVVPSQSIFHIEFQYGNHTYNIEGSEEAMKALCHAFYLKNNNIDEGISF